MRWARSESCVWGLGGRSSRRLSPSFRVGPLLLDPTAVRLPRTGGLPRKVSTSRTDPQSSPDDPVAAAAQIALLVDVAPPPREGHVRVAQIAYLSPCPLFTVWLKSPCHAAEAPESPIR
jgi:hypothetical protein